MAVPKFQASNIAKTYKMHFSPHKSFSLVFSETGGYRNQWLLASPKRNDTEFSGFERITSFHLGLSLGLEELKLQPLNNVALLEVGHGAQWSKVGLEVK